MPGFRELLTQFEVAIVTYSPTKKKPTYYKIFSQSTENSIVDIFPVPDSNLLCILTDVEVLHLVNIASRKIIYTLNLMIFIT